MSPGRTKRRNQNRGYRDLRVWEDAIELYRLTCVAFRPFPYELKRIASQESASVDSIHCNIAEGYCRRSLKEYLYPLSVALGSLGESLSGLVACRKAGQITEDQYEQLDELAYRLENGLLRLVESLQAKQSQVKEDQAGYGTSQDSTTPIAQFPMTSLVYDSESMTPPCSMT